MFELSFCLFLVGFVNFVVLDLLVLMFGVDCCFGLNGVFGLGRDSDLGGIAGFGVLCLC